MLVASISKSGDTIATNCGTPDTQIYLTQLDIRVYPLSPV